jgi:primosomal protein N' (replication factor Y)
MPPSFIDLAVPGSVDRVFTYSVPEHLRALARPGVRALAPFGKKTVAGIVVATPASTEVRGIRDIFDIIDEHPVLDDGLLSLAHWISGYYHSPIGEVLRAMLIAGFTGVGKTTVISAAPVTPEVLASLGRSPLQRSILERLAPKGKVSLSTLRKEFAAVSIHPALHELRRKGLITLEEEAPYQGAAAKTEQVVPVSAGDGPRWSEWLAVHGANKRAAKQAEVVLALSGCAPGDVPVRELLRDHRLSPSALATLVRNGVVAAGRREVVRDGGAAGEHREEHRDITLNAHQSAALRAILEPVEAGTFGAFLLWGITGSGKTQVYIEAIARALELGRTALVLVPEISLTPQTVGRFRRSFGERVLMFHSRMSRGERYDAWRLARDGRCSIVIGPRRRTSSMTSRRATTRGTPPSCAALRRTPRWCSGRRRHQSRVSRTRSPENTASSSSPNAPTARSSRRSRSSTWSKSGGRSSRRSARPGRWNSRPTRSWPTFR